MNARDFALLAQEAYSAKPDIGEADSASRAIIRQTAAGLCIAFRGSDDEESWLADFDIGLVKVDGAGNIHRGFWTAYQAIATDIVQAIGDQSVTLVGHSLGGSLALCCAVSLALDGKPPAAVYAFEPARITPDLGARNLLSNVSTHLYKTGNDIVPDLPVGWQHPALLTRIGKPSLPFPNTLDHAISRVIDSLT